MSLLPVAVGFGGGSLGTLCLKLLVDVLQAPSPFVVEDLLGDPETCDCGQGVHSEILGFLEGLDLKRIHWGSLFLGLCLGLIAWLLLDLLIVLRIRWNQSLFRAQAQVPRGGSQNYRILSGTLNE